MDVPQRCPLSDPVHPHTLSCQENPPPRECFWCGPDGEAFEDGDEHYYCDICELVFHNSYSYCYFLLLGKKHPYHLNHFLNLTVRFSETETQSISNLAEYKESSLKMNSFHSFLFETNNACDWCGKKLGNMFYRCLVCGFSLDNSCIRKDPPFTITNPKSHQHPLTLFPRPLLVPCNACGLVDKKDPGYVCLPCNYVVHKTCIHLPRVIKLTRHPHRLSYTSYLPPPSKRSCGVCHRKVDVKYGMYSCNKGCSYAVHSKCATHKDIWDGIDLEEVPEEPIEDVAPFEEVGYNLIKHFSHEHHLRFNEDALDHDANKECQACSRPIDDSGGFYKCTILHCDFFLHAPCANFPKKKEHPVHKHPLTLLLPRANGEWCVSCGREFCGFIYKCYNDSCNEHKAFEIDVRCASVSEPFEHKVHHHPLFLFSGGDVLSRCQICNRKTARIYTLNCNDCEFSMCFKCATIPVVIRYKYDDHLLTLCGGEDSSDPYWCERCEKQIDPKKWFYTCNECCTTLHIGCVFGDSAYIKTGSRFIYRSYGFTFVSNNSNSRPVCNKCGVRCLYAGFFKAKDLYMCSMECLHGFMNLYNSGS